MKIEDILQTSFVHGPVYHKDYAELERMLQIVERQNKGAANLEIIGKSLEGRDIYCLGLGNKSSENNVLMVANAHGEELTGTEELLHIIRTLTENPSFKTFLQDYHFSIIPTINPDSIEHNLRWAKSMDLGKFFLTYKRAASDNETETDLEWSYPIDDKNIASIKRPELAAMVQLMNSQKFDLYINLHGSIGTYFTGFWYMIEETKEKKDELIKFLHKSGKHTGLPLLDIEMGALCPQLSPGVYGIITTKKILENIPSLKEAYKTQNSASSFDYFMIKNPAAQCICCELPVFYHEKYLDKSLSDQKVSDLQKGLINYYLQLWKEKITSLTEKAISIDRHPKLEKYLENIKRIEIESLENELSKLKKEKSDKKATMGEARRYEMERYWLSPGYGKGGYAASLFGKGLGSVIANLPSESKHNLKNIYAICEHESEEAAKKVKSLGLRELLLSDSIDIQGRTCMGTVLTYFNPKRCTK